MRYLLNILLSFTLMNGVWLEVASAQTLSEQQAAKETYIDGLRLLEAAAQEPRLTTLGIHLGYVEQDTRPGGGRYFCGAMSRHESRSAGRIITTALLKLPDTLEPQCMESYYHCLAPARLASPGCASDRFGWRVQPVIRRWSSTALVQSLRSGRLPEDHAHLVGQTIIHERNSRRAARKRLAIQLDAADSTIHAVRVLNRDLVARGVILVDDLESGPLPGYAGGQEQERSL